MRPLGIISVAGREETASVFEPWPADAPPQWRERYLAAFALMDRDPLRAAELFETLAAEFQGDAVVQVMAKKLRASSLSPPSP